MYVVVI